MAAGRSQTYTFRDSKQQTGQLHIYLDSTATAAAAQANGSNLGVDLAALTNAIVEAAKGPYTNPAQPVSAGSAATYESVEDKAVITFTTATGVLHRYGIPAPLSTIFQADGETVDFSVAVVKQFVADMINATFSGTAVSAGTTKATVSRNGEALSAAVGGTRLRRKQVRKFNVYTRNPGLSGQGL